MNRIAKLSIHTCPLDPLGGEVAGGMNVYVKEVSKELGRRGIKVDIFTRAKTADLPQVVHISEEVRVVHLSAGKLAPIGKELIADHITEFTQGIHKFAAEQNVTYDLLHSHYWLSGLVAQRLRKAWGLPFVQMFHTLGKLKNMASGENVKKDPPRRIAAELKIIGSADLMVAGNPREKANMIKFYGARSDKIRIIPCGVDTNLFKPIPREEVRKHLDLGQEKIILFVGRIEPIKNIDSLIRAVAIINKERPFLRPLKLLLVGGESRNGDSSVPVETARLKRLSDEMELNGQVKFLGPMEQEKLPFYYSAADVCVLPSYYESFGMVAIEAMACGTPMLASRVGGLPFTIKDGVNGYLFSQGKVDELVSKLNLLLNDDQLKSKLGHAGVESAKKYGWETITSELMSIYSEIMFEKDSHLKVRERPLTNQALASM